MRLLKKKKKNPHKTPETITGVGNPRRLPVDLGTALLLETSALVSSEQAAML